MNPSCLQYRLSDQERKTFEEEGLICVEEALSQVQVESLVALLDQIYIRALSDGHPPGKAFFAENFIPTNGLFADLVDYERTFPKVWGILGWNIYLYHAHLAVTPPSSKPRSEAALGWHQDSGQLNWDIETHPRPRLSVKVAYFLSDTSEEGRGNFWVVPGSHRRDALERPDEGHGQPAGAVPVLAKPGTAVFFDRRLWHAASTNWSEVTRKVLFYGYGYRWIRAHDDMTDIQDLWPQSDPIRRQLLGDGVNARGHFNPTDADVPLRVWLHKHSPDGPRS